MTYKKRQGYRNLRGALENYENEEEVVVSENEDNTYDPIEDTFAKDLAEQVKEEPETAGAAEEVIIADNEVKDATKELDVALEALESHLAFKDKLIASGGLRSSASLEAADGETEGRLKKVTEWFKKVWAGIVKLFKQAAKWVGDKLKIYSDKRYHGYLVDNEELIRDMTKSDVGRKEFTKVKLNIVEDLQTAGKETARKSLSKSAGNAFVLAGEPGKIKEIANELSVTIGILKNREEVSTGYYSLLQEIEDFNTEALEKIRSVKTFESYLDSRLKSNGVYISSIKEAGATLDKVSKENPAASVIERIKSGGISEEQKILRDLITICQKYVQALMSVSSNVAKYDKTIINLAKNVVKMSNENFEGEEVTFDSEDAVVTDEVLVEPDGTPETAEERVIETTIESLERNLVKLRRARRKASLESLDGYSQEGFLGGVTGFVASLLIPGGVPLVNTAAQNMARRKKKQIEAIENDINKIRQKGLDEALKSGEINKAKYEAIQESFGTKKDLIAILQGFIPFYNLYKVVSSSSRLENLMEEYKAQCKELDTLLKRNGVTTSDLTTESLDSDYRIKKIRSYSLLSEEEIDAHEEVEDELDEVVEQGEGNEEIVSEEVDVVEDVPTEEEEIIEATIESLELQKLQLGRINRRKQRSLKHYSLLNEEVEVEVEDPAVEVEVTVNEDAVAEDATVDSEEVEEDIEKLEREEDRIEQDIDDGGLSSTNVDRIEETLESICEKYKLRAVRLPSLEGFNGGIATRVHNSELVLDSVKAVKKALKRLV